MCVFASTTVTCDSMYIVRKDLKWLQLDLQHFLINYDIHPVCRSCWELPWISPPQWEWIDSICHLSWLTSHLTHTTGADSKLPSLFIAKAWVIHMGNTNLCFSPNFSQQLIFIHFLNAVIRMFPVCVFFSATHAGGFKSVGDGFSRKSSVSRCQPGSLCLNLTDPAPKTPPVTADEQQFARTVYTISHERDTRAHKLPYSYDNFPSSTRFMVFKHTCVCKIYGLSQLVVP